MVLTDKEGYKSVDYSRMTPVLLQAIKEQQQLIENLEAQLQHTQHTNAALQKSNAANVLRIEKIEELLEIGVQTMGTE